MQISSKERGTGMNREYDTYGPNELLAHSKMPLKIVKDDKELYSGLAR